MKKNKTKLYSSIFLFLIGVLLIAVYIFLNEAVEMSEPSKLLLSAFTGFSVVFIFYLAIVYFQVHYEESGPQYLIKKTNRKYELSDKEIQKEIDKLYAKIEQSSSIDKDIEKEINEQIKALEINRLRNSQRKIKEIDMLLETA